MTNRPLPEEEKEEKEKGWGEEAERTCTTIPAKRSLPLPEEEEEEEEERRTTVPPPGAPPTRFQAWRPGRLVWSSAPCSPCWAARPQ